MVEMSDEHRREKERLEKAAALAAREAERAVNAANQAKLDLEEFDRKAEKLSRLMKDLKPQR